MPVKVVLAGVVAFGCSCGAPCTPVDRSRPEDVCYPADAGKLTAGVPFVLVAQTSFAGTCTVSVDGGQVDLFISGTPSCFEPHLGTGMKPVAVASQVRCDVPALPEGFYTLNTLTPESFSLPDAGLPPCP